LTNGALAVAAGIALGAIAVLSPLTVVAAIAAGLTLAAARRGVPAEERRWLTGVILAALAARVLVVLALFAVNLASQSAQNPGILFGDETFSLTRSLRMRNILLEFPVS